MWYMQSTWNALSHVVSAQYIVDLISVNRKCCYFFFFFFALPMAPGKCFQPASKSSVSCHKVIGIKVQTLFLFHPGLQSLLFNQHLKVLFLAEKL